MSPSGKDSWNVAWSHQANPGACVSGVGGAIGPPLLVDFLQIPSHWDPEVPLLNKALSGPHQTNLGLSPSQSLIPAIRMSLRARPKRDPS